MSTREVLGFFTRDLPGLPLFQLGQLPFGNGTRPWNICNLYDIVHERWVVLLAGVQHVLWHVLCFRSEDGPIWLAHVFCLGRLTNSKLTRSFQNKHFANKDVPWSKFQFASVVNWFPTNFIHFRRFLAALSSPSLVQVKVEVCWTPSHSTSRGCWRGSDIPW